MKKNKNLKIIKEDIESRLKLSNPELWESLTKVEKDKVINKYIYLTSVDHLGIEKILERNSILRSNLLFIFISLMLGFFGNLFSESIKKYLPVGLTFDVFIIIFFITLVILFYKQINKLSAESLEDEQILKRLLDMDLKIEIKNK